MPNRFFRSNAHLLQIHPIFIVWLILPSGESISVIYWEIWIEPILSSTSVKFLFPQKVVLSKRIEVFSQRNAIQCLRVMNVDWSARWPKYYYFFNVPKSPFGFKSVSFRRLKLERRKKNRECFYSQFLACDINQEIMLLWYDGAFFNAFSST